MQNSTTENEQRQVGHTPVPWEDVGGIIRSSRENGGEGWMIADCPTNSPNFSANAAFIVKAVNAHEGLVAALENITTAYVMVRDGFGEHQKAYEDAVKMIASLSGRVPQ